ncbi:hypothetical protein [Aquitalea aquatica]|uniref:Uncharacterized protein n=1 Tax=Aquitalea aquatica TaxID=3044273 RepID=A0A838YFI4_9NEIS|nr:hypothetical protein [Aquitalea magnusonii]MBA4709825.1 hypothetical protein [Aquitalea magnusonii]
MLIFALLSLLVIAAIVAWSLKSGKRNNRKGADDSRIYAAHTQSRPLEPLEHSTGHAFGLLLKAARGDRSVVEKWIMAEQHQNIPPISRDGAIEQLAQRLQASRR